MIFKPPGGELTIWSVIWIVFGVGSCVAAFVTGNAGYLIQGAAVGLPAIGMWFDQRWCGYLLAGLLAISILLAILALVMVDDTLTERAYRVARIVMAGYFAFISVRWAHEA